METHSSLEHHEDPLSAELACDGVLSPQRTTFGKLVALSFSRVKESGEYYHSQLAITFSRELVSRVLESRHERVFREWLALSLEEQHKDLTEFLASDLDGNAQPPFQDLEVLIPAAATIPERTLFFDDLAFVLALMDNN